MKTATLKTFRAKDALETLIGESVMWTMEECPTCAHPLSAVVARGTTLCLRCDTKYSPETVSGGMLVKHTWTPADNPVCERCQEPHVPDEEGFAFVMAGLCRPCVALVPNMKVMVTENHLGDKWYALMRKGSQRCNACKGRCNLDAMFFGNVCSACAYELCYEATGHWKPWWWWSRRDMMKVDGVVVNLTDYQKSAADSEEHIEDMLSVVAERLHRQYTKDARPIELRIGLE